jgi:hypothetical protein
MTQLYAREKKKVLRREEKRQLAGLRRKMIMAVCSSNKKKNTSGTSRNHLSRDLTNREDLGLLLSAFWREVSQQVADAERSLISPLSFLKAR